MRVKKYILNCFLLLVPIFLWNVFLVDYLPSSYSPEVFDSNIPTLISYGENALRFIVFVLPAIMILSMKTRIEKIGLSFYLLGTLIYFSSWVAVIHYPNSYWSLSGFGFTAPAHTTIIWFIGIGLIGNKSFLKIPHFSKIYIALSVLFVLFHTLHASIVFNRL